MIVWTDVDVASVHFYPVTVAVPGGRISSLLILARCSVRPFAVRSTSWRISFWYVVKLICYYIDDIINYFYPCMGLSPVEATPIFIIIIGEQPNEPRHKHSARQSTLTSRKAASIALDYLFFRRSFHERSDLMTLTFLIWMSENILSVSNLGLHILVFYHLWNRLPLVSTYL